MNFQRELMIVSKLPTLTSILSAIYCIAIPEILQKLLHKTINTCLSDSSWFLKVYMFLKTCLHAEYVGARNKRRIVVWMLSSRNLICMKSSLLAISKTRLHQDGHWTIQDCVKTPSHDNLLWDRVFPPLSHKQLIIHQIYAKLGNERHLVQVKILKFLIAQHK